MNRQRRVWLAIRASILAAAAAIALLLSAGGRADAQLGGFVLPGGYAFTWADARGAMGSPTFYRETTFFRRSLGAIAGGLSGGIDVISASDRFFPFSGGNEFNLVGPGVRLSTVLAPGSRLRPFFSVGLYAGRVRSHQLGIDRWDFTPSATAGVDTVLGEALILRIQYRASERLSGVNTDGVAVSLHAF